MINNANIQFERAKKNLDTSNKTAQKNHEIECRDKHYNILANYINNNTKDIVRIVNDKIYEHIKILEKLLQKENFKLQNEVVLLNDNMNKDINNLDEQKQIFELRIELQNKINEENEKLSS